MPASVRARHQRDEAQIEPRTHAAQVELVEAQLPARRQPVAAAPDARRQLRALRARPDQAHLAPEDVPRLRQLVNVPAPEHPADRGDARIPRSREHGAGAGLRAPAHGAELDDPEHPPAAPEARLAEQHGARRV